MKILWFLPTHGDSRYLGTTQGRARRRLRLLQADRHRRRQPGLRRRADPHRPLLRRLVGAGGEPDRRDAAAEVPGRAAPGAGAADAVGAHGGHLRPAVRRAAARQPGHRRRPERTGRRRPVPRPRRALRSSRPSSSASGARCCARSTTARASISTASTCSVKGAKLLYPPMQQAVSAGVLRRLVRSRARTRGRAGRHLPDLGRAARRRGRRRWPTCARAPRKHGRTLQFGIRLHVIVRETEDEAWRAAAELIVAPRRRRPSPRAQAKFAQMDSVGQRRMAALHRAASTSATSARAWRSRPTCGPASAWCAAVPARRWWAAPSRWPRASRSTRSWASTTSSSPATRTWKKRTASPNWCSRCCRWSCSASCRGRALTGPFGEIVANHYRARAAAPAEHAEGRACHVEPTPRRRPELPPGGSRAAALGAAAAADRRLADRLDAAAGCRRACCPSRWRC